MPLFCVLLVILLAISLLRAQVCNVFFFSRIRIRIRTELVKTTTPSFNMIVILYSSIWVSGWIRICPNKLWIRILHWSRMPGSGSTAQVYLLEECIRSFHMPFLRAFGNFTSNFFTQRSGSAMFFFHGFESGSKRSFWKPRIRLLIWIWMIDFL